MAEPADHRAAGGAYRRLRASHADRDRVIDVLKAAFIKGKLAKDEFDQRVGQALTSRTHGDLAAITSDIPAALAVARPPSVPARQSDERKFVNRLAYGFVAVPTTLVGVALIAGHHLTPAAIVLHILLFACTMAVPAILLVMLHSWLDKHETRPT